MKNYTVVPNRISSLFSPNDLYTLIGLYFTTNSNYSTDSTYLQIADITKQSFSYIKVSIRLRTTCIIDSKLKATCSSWPKLG
ncbi:hypothetical protein POZ13_10015, partial [Bacteroides uniformis]|nr:hypothetical protein [Bacteroides uniformis]MDC1826979.1 hypothetical protein [Bacteroides uniformis]MDC1834452.1 hypothetical protein [Bacteroides uniformis]